MMKSTPAVVFALLISITTSAYAHDVSEAFLTLDVGNTHIDGELKLNTEDIGPALALDANGDGAIDWDEIVARQDDIQNYISERLHVQVGGEALPPYYTNLLYGSQGGHDLVVSRFRMTTEEVPQELAVSYTALFDVNLQHQAFVRIEWPGGEVQDGVLSVGTAHQVFSPGGGSPQGFLQFLKSGIWHIWIGYDHILFLLALLIPSVFRRTGSRDTTVAGFRPTLIKVAAIVSAFTVAHSITLTLAALDVVQLPGRLVESAIAASVFIAALLNLLPARFRFQGAWLAFAFGLLHGFGFAGVLGEIYVDAREIWRPLLGFNLGVEIGQLAIVAVFLPLAYLLRETRFYRVGVMYVGSTGVAICALFWLSQRAF